MRRFPVLLLLALALTGCEQLGFDDPAKAAAIREAEGKAIGSACRQSGRALEDCYSLYSKASKAAIFSGWRDMDAYMRENNLQEVLPETVEPPAAKKPVEPPKAAAPAEKPAAEEKPAPAEKKPAKTGAAGSPTGGEKRMT